MTVRRIVVGHDGSSGADRALAFTAELAARLGAEVVVVRGYNPLEELGRATPPIDFHALEERARVRLHDETCRPLAEAGVVFRSLLVEESGLSAIVSTAAEERADLVVVGSHGRTGWRARVLGRVARRLPQMLACPVTIVPTGPGDAAA